MSRENPSNSIGGDNNEKPKIDRDVLDKFFNGRNDIKDSIPPIGPEEPINDGDEEAIESVGEDENMGLKGKHRNGRKSKKNGLKSKLEEGQPEGEKNESFGRASIRMSEEDVPEKTKPSSVVSNIITEGDKEKSIKGLLLAHKESMPDQQTVLGPQESVIDLAELGPETIWTTINKLNYRELAILIDAYIEKIKIKELSQLEREEEKHRIMGIDKIINNILDDAEKRSIQGRLKHYERNVCRELEITQENLRKLYNQIDQKEEKIPSIDNSSEELAKKVVPEIPKVEEGIKSLEIESKEGPKKEEVRPEEKPKKELSSTSYEQIKKKQEEIKQAEEKMAIYRPLGWFRKKPVVRDLGYYAADFELNKLKNELKELQEIRRKEIRRPRKMEKGTLEKTKTQEGEEVNLKEQETEERIEKIVEKVRADVKKENEEIDRIQEEKREVKEEKKKIGFWKGLFRRNKNVDNVSMPEMKEFLKEQKQKEKELQKMKKWRRDAEKSLEKAKKRKNKKNFLGI